MINLKIIHYRDGNGVSPFQNWYRRLDRLAARKVYLAMIRIEAGNMSDSKRLKGGIWERRIHWGPGYRLYYGLDRRRFAIMLAGGTKKTQRADIKNATRNWYEYKSPKK
jgi:putative addiction module killer protein